MSTIMQIDYYKPTTVTYTNMLTVYYESAQGFVSPVSLRLKYPYTEVGLLTHWQWHSQGVWLGVACATSS